MSIDRTKMTKYRNGKKVRDPKTDVSGAQKFSWWKSEGQERARQIGSTIKFIATHQSQRIEQLTVGTRLYGNSSAYNLYGTAFTRASSASTAPSSQRLSFNLVASIVDSLTSRIAQNRVVACYLTQGGVWSMQKKAKDLTKFTDGIGYQNKVHEKAVTAFKDCAVWGDGLVHVYAKDKQICVERALPHEFFVDQIETLNNAPRQLHRVKIVDREIAISEYGDDPKVKELLVSAMPSNYLEIGGSGTAVDMITLTESWHLPSKKFERGDKKCDGVHVICCGEDEIFSEPYYKDYFPFPVMSYTKRLIGYWAQGAAERVQSIQGEINRNMILVQKSFWMGGSFKILVENGSKVVTQHLNNEVGTIIHYTGTPPQYITPPTIQQEIIPYIDALIDKGYRQEGVNQLTAAGVKPLGLDSGKALREVTQMEDDRFTFMEQNFEQFNLEIYRQCIEVAKDIYEDEGHFEVTFPSGKFLETVDWKNIDLEEDEYVLKAFPKSSLPEDPAARYQSIQEYMQAGLITPRTGRRLMNMPDIEMTENLANAAEDLLHKVIEEMLDSGKYRPPEPSWDLTLANQLVVQYLNYAELHNAPEGRLSLLRKFQLQLQDIVKMGTPPPAPMPQAQPQANPTSTPQSNMVPNVNQGAA